MRKKRHWWIFLWQVRAICRMAHSMAGMPYHAVEGYFSKSSAVRRIWRFVNRLWSIEQRTCGNVKVCELLRQYGQWWSTVAWTSRQIWLLRYIKKKGKFGLATLDSLGVFSFVNLQIKKHCVRNATYCACKLLYCEEFNEMAAIEHCKGLRRRPIWEFGTCTAITLLNRQFGNKRFARAFGL